MQTFITSFDIKETARILDNKRLGKQRIESIQIAKLCLEINNNRWRNHPAVLMWEGYESYLIKVYLYIIMNEWKERGYKNIKCEIDYRRLYELVKNNSPRFPNWITKEFILSHQSNLVRKKPEYYRKFFPDVPDDLPYIWPKNSLNK